MINLKNTLLSTASLLLVFASINTVQANNSGVIFPPANAMNNHQFPPQVPVAPRLNGYPQAPYVFGQNGKNQQPMPMMRAPQYNNNFAQQRRPMQAMPFGSPNRNFRNAPQRYNNNNNSFPLMNSLPFGNNSSNSFNPFSNGNMPFSGNNLGGQNNPMINMFGNNSNRSIPFFNNNTNSNRKKAWGDERNIWPDFYTDFTDDAWDTMMSGPRDLGRMPGGWRFPYISMPDPVTVSDAITNQFPPIAEEAGNMADFSDWGVFEDK